MPTFLNEKTILVRQKKNLQNQDSRDKIVVISKIILQLFLN